MHARLIGRIPNLPQVDDTRDAVCVISPTGAIVIANKILHILFGRVTLLFSMSAVARNVRSAVRAGARDQPFVSPHASHTLRLPWRQQVPKERAQGKERVSASAIAVRRKTQQLPPKAHGDGPGASLCTVLCCFCNSCMMTRSVSSSHAAATFHPLFQHLHPLFSSLRLRPGLPRCRARSWAPSGSSRPVIRTVTRSLSAYQSLRWRSAPRSISCALLPVSRPPTFPLSLTIE